MTPKGFADYIRQRTKSTVDTFTDAEMLISINAILPEFSDTIDEVGRNGSGTIHWHDIRPTGTGYDDGTSTFTREYSLPARCTNTVVMVEAKIGSNGEWLTLDPKELNILRHATDEDTILSRYRNSEGYCGFYLFGNSIWLLTGQITTSITKGLKFHVLSFPDSFANVTFTKVDLKEWGIPKGFQLLFADAIIIDWKSSRDNPIALTEHEMSYQNRLNFAINRAKESLLSQEVKTGEDDSFMDGDGSEY